MGSVTLWGSVADLGIFFGNIAVAYGGRERSIQGAGGETRGEETAGETKA